MGFEQLNLPEIFYVRAQTQNTENCSKTSNIRAVKKHLAHDKQVVDCG